MAAPGPSQTAQKVVNLPLDGQQCRDLLDLLKISFLDHDYDWQGWHLAEAHTLSNSYLDGLYKQKKMEMQRRMSNERIREVYLFSCFTTEMDLADTFLNGLQAQVTHFNLLGRSHGDLVELDRLVQQLPPPLLLLGDFNAHSELWGSEELRPSGRVVEDFIAGNDLSILNTGSQTYLHPASGSFIVIDLSLCSPSAHIDFTWEVDTDQHGSDHFPIFISTLFSSSCDNIEPPGNSRFGTNLCKHADVQLKAASQSQVSDCWLIMYKDTYHVSHPETVKRSDKVTNISISICCIQEFALLTSDQKYFRIYQTHWSLYMGEHDKVALGRVQKVYPKRNLVSRMPHKDFDCFCSVFNSDSSSLISEQATHSQENFKLKIFLMLLYVFF
ncbi:hypothetical protein CAPTEDRAFT_217144 [Capitella teleta]|uniref:Endonuclease/exonuclease/phosphatase domain-containing protein n=1 Tax=Capitella teleta TaxID=283909 RepID=R7VK84_CAPTE|nr:hypothetical protein CAPTEDRAFT_217144 [Capitella teleta]|eukprot:ELU17121.1 hypothetical protein CAPTEDRAFT_217144 [Capitella teleta]